MRRGDAPVGSASAHAANDHAAPWSSWEEPWLGSPSPPTSASPDKATPSLTLSSATFSALAKSDELPQCTDADFYPVYDCTFMRVGYTRNSTSCAGTREPTELAKCPEWCHKLDTDNFAPVNGECRRSADGSMRLTRYWRYRDVRCMNKLLPPPIFNVPCDVVCPIGEHRSSFYGDKCEPCPEGTFAVNGGIVYEPLPGFNASSVLPDAFQHDCTLYSVRGSAIGACSGWQVDPYFFHSGAVSPGAASVSYESSLSVLKLPVYLVRPGSASFLFRVHGSPGSSFGFLVDDHSAMNVTLRRPVWTRHTVTLAPGFHTLKWLFSKTKPESVGLDRAEIRSIEVVGTRWSGMKRDECMPCPPGSFTDQKGSGLCAVCPENTFASHASSAGCQPCPAGTFSSPGAAQCTPRRPCVAKDYYKLFTPCKHNRHTAYYAWRQSNAYCDPALPDSVALPANETDIQCAECPPGTKVVPSSLECETCPPGTFSAGGHDSCHTCPAGHVAPRTRAFASLREWPAEFNATAEWELVDGIFDTGRGIPRFESAVLDINLAWEIPGILVLSLRQVCEDLCTLSVSIDGEEDMILTENDDPDVVNRTITDLSPGPHVIRLNFTKFGSSEDAQFEDRAELLGVWAVGTTTGGAAACKPCSPGFFGGPTAAQCKICPPGTFTNRSAAVECTGCPENTFAPGRGNDECKACGAGTFSSAGSAECTTDCTFSTAPNVVFNVSALRSRVFSPVAVSANVSDADICHSVGHRRYEASAHSVYFSVCGRFGDKAEDPCYNEGEFGQPLTPACLVEHSPATQYDYSYSLGEVLSYYPVLNGSFKESLSPSEFSDGTGFTISYTGADDSGCDEIVFNVTLLCDLSAGEGVPRPLVGDDPSLDECSYAVLWRTKYGCRLCTEDDYELHSSRCVNSRRTVTPAWKATAYCMGGVQLPPPSAVPCVPHGVRMPIVMGAVAVASLALLWALYLYIQNRRIYSEYARITQAGTSLADPDELGFPSMGTVGFEDDDEDMEMADMSRGRPNKAQQQQQQQQQQLPTKKTNTAFSLDD